MTDSLRIDSHKLEFHPHRVAAWLEGADDWERAKKVYPLYVEISPVGACNHRCTFCAVDYIGYKPRILDTPVLEQFFSEADYTGVKSVMLAGEGEPLLHKEINEVVSVAKDWNLDVAFTTNGILLNKLDLAPVTWVKVSINAGTRETYLRVHKAKPKDWDILWENLRDAAKRKGACTLGAQIVLLPENLHEVGKLYELCEEAGLDYLVAKPYSQHKSSVTHTYEGFRGVPLGMITGKCQFIFRQEAWRTTSIPYEKCNATPFFWAYIMASGDVYSCSAYLLDDRFRLGNIHEQTFKEIWEGPKRKANWELLRKHLDIKECRVNCRMDKANRYLDGFSSTEHINFI